MGTLNKHELFQELRLPTEVVELKSGTVIMTELSGPDYIKIYSDPANRTTNEEGEEVLEMGRFQAALICYGAVDENGNRIFDDSDIETIKRGAQGPFLKLAEAARKLNGLTGEEEKNSDDNQPESPSIASV